MSTNVLSIERDTPQSGGWGELFTPQFSLLVIVCLITVTVEGLTRGASIEYGGGNGDMDVFTFGPIFAWITLPLVLLYVQSVKIRLSEGLLLWLVLGSIVYDRSFAYTKIPGIPIFVTDIVLGICTYELWTEHRFRFNKLGKWNWVFFSLFFAAGCLAAARGFLGGQEKEKIVRDFALVLYTAFVLVSLSIHRSWLPIKRYLLFGALGGVLTTVNAFMWFITTPDMRRYIPSPVYVQAVFVAAVVLRIRGWKGWKINALIACSVLGMLLGNARSTDLVAAVALVCIFITSALLWRSNIARLVKTVILTFATTAVLLVGALQTEIGQQFVDRNFDELVSGVHYEEDDNAVFRLLAWAEAYRRFSENPAFGEGYGIPFVFALADNDPRPHNTYLTVLYKMGLVGFIPLAVILTLYYWRSLRALHRFKKLPNSTWLLLLIVIQFSFCAYGALNLLLESPFLASLFWINMGMTVSVILLLKQESGRVRLQS